MHIFVGHIEAPLLIRPYLLRLERGELFALMSCGMAGIAGTVMVLYASILGPVIPDALGNILVAAVISTPAALALAALMVPFRPDTVADGRAGHRRPAGQRDGRGRQGHARRHRLSRQHRRDAGGAGGAGQPAEFGARAAAAISAATPITLQRLFAYAFRPVMWLIGIPAGEVAAAAQLMGTKIVLNEFIAYVDLAKLPAGELSDHSRLVMTYAMCGFANFGSLGILIGGMGAMVPERRPEIVALGLQVDPLRHDGRLHVGRNGEDAAVGWKSEATSTIHQTTADDAALIRSTP